MLKGGGCENMNAQYSLPHPDLGGRDLKGVENAILDAAKKKLDRAVDKGVLTRAQADDLLDGLKARVHTLVNGTFMVPFGARLWHHPGFAPEFRSFHNGPPASPSGGTST